MEDLQPSRPSILDVILSRYTQSKTRTPSNTRLLYTCRKQSHPSNSKSHSTIMSVRQTHETLFERLPEHKISDFPFGLLVESQDGCLHILEGKTLCVVQFLRALWNHVSRDPSSCLSDVKILNITDDIGTVMFPRWGYIDVEQFHHDDDDEDFIQQYTNMANAAAQHVSHNGNVSARGTDSNKNSEEAQKAKQLENAWVQAIHLTEHKLLNIGKKILSFGPKQMDIFLKAATTNVPHLVPSPILINNLNKCEKCLTLKEWIEIYDTSVDIESDSELIWPHPPPLFPFVSETEQLQ